VTFMSEQVVVVEVHNPALNVRPADTRRLAKWATVMNAKIAPLFESVPPRLYGGTERVVTSLTEEPVRQGHQMTCLRAKIPSRLPNSFAAPLFNLSDRRRSILRHPAGAKT
jgi:hypothetical protein